MADDIPSCRNDGTVFSCLFRVKDERRGMAMERKAAEGLMENKLRLSCGFQVQSEFSGFSGRR